MIRISTDYSVCLANRCFRSWFAVTQVDEARAKCHGWLNTFLQEPLPLCLVNIVLNYFVFEGQQFSKAKPKSQPEKSQPKKSQKKTSSHDANDTDRVCYRIAHEIDLPDEEMNVHSCLIS